MATTAAPPATVASMVLSSRLAARIPIPGNADWLAAGPGGLWVKRDDGWLSLVDTVSNKVVDNVEIGGEGYCQGLGVSDGGVWTCSGDDVVRYDPASRSITRRWTNGKVGDQGELNAVAGRIWVGTGDARTLAGIDPTGTSPDVGFALPVRVSDVGVCDDTLWIASQGESRVLRIDPATGKVLVDAPLDGARAVACSGDVWAVGTREAVRLDPTTGARLAEVPIEAGLGGSVAIGERSVWVRATAPFLTRIDRASGKPVETFSSPDAPSIGDIVVTAGSVWTTASDDDVLFRLNGDT